MILTVFLDDRIETLTLPQKPAGHYVLGSSDRTARPAAFVDGQGGCWLLTPAEGLTLTPVQEGGSSSASVPLSCPGSFLLHHSGGSSILILSEPVLPERGRFIKVSLPKKGQFLIGRSDRCDICFASPALSARHALLIRSNGRTMIRDEDSTNGVYVNSRRVFAQALRPGDLVFVAGLKLIFCGDHLAVSPPDERLSFSGRLQPYHYSMKNAGPSPVRIDAPTSPFLRPPRMQRRIEPLALTIDPPPSPPSGDELPLALVLGSTLSMGMMSVVMLISALSTGNTASVFMGGAMLFGSLIMPLITKRYERRRAKKREILRKERYRSYLEDLRKTFSKACETQEEILRENAPSPLECAARILQTGPRLWERSLRRDGLPTLRAGLGELPLEAELSVPAHHFSLDDDPLRAGLFTLCDEPKLLREVPVTWPSETFPVFGACGNDPSVQTFAAGLILQLAALYDSQDLKLVLVCDCKKYPLFSFVRLLPHVWSEERDFRFLAEDAAGARELSAWFEPLIETRTAMSEEALSEASPCYAFFFPDPELAARTELYKKLLSLRRSLRFLVYVFVPGLQALPRESGLVAEISDGKGRLFSPDDISGICMDFVPDPVPQARLRLLAVKLANLEPPARRRRGFPAVLPFLHLFGAGRTEHLNSADRWRSSDPSRSLAVPVGTGPDGCLLYLDLHERFHGPHALVAGMTGSGKSEWLSTYILSLSIHFSPQEVSFVLIDYKGGGMAGAFADLPHTAGIMTNLSGSGIARTLISLQSELLRRQALLAGACRRTGTGSIDIHDYQRRVREGHALEPLAHLFVICDEFAELKMHHPEFMEQLISTARIGRSLGVHLILATQKPGGIVDDQIRSNCRARICLKVQDRADSMEMLERPDAAALSAAGRFYLQVGSHELFETGQAAWAGAPYLPADRPEQAFPSVRVIDQNGHVLRSASLQPLSLPFVQHQQDAVIRYLRQTAQDEGLAARPLWLEPLGEARTLQELLQEYEGDTRMSADRHSFCTLSPVLGEFDDPARQRRGLLRLPLSEKGHTALFGMPGSGKTEALAVLLWSAVTELSPDELRLYLLDFEAGTLASFLPAPHTGGILTAIDGPARIDLLLKWLEDEIASRRQAFAFCGGSYDGFAKSSAASPPPRIFLVIHNYTAFTECFPEAEERLGGLMRDPARFGIHLLVTAAAPGNIRYRSLQNFTQLLTLQQSDAAEYALILGPTGGLIPGEQKGRGLIRLEDVVEFQTAAICRDEQPFSFIRSGCLRLRGSWTGASAPQLPAMPEKITVKLLASQQRSPAETDRLALPIGYDCTALVPYFYDLSARGLTPVLSEGSCLPFFTLLTALLLRVGRQTLVLDPSDPGTAEAQLKKTADGSLADSIVYLIPDLPALFDTLSEETSAQLRDLLEQAARGVMPPVIFGGSPQELSPFTYEKWFRTGISTREGIWLGPGISGQYLLKAPSAAAYDSCSPQTAICLQGGRAVPVRLPEDLSI